MDAQQSGNAQPPATVAASDLRSVDSIDYQHQVDVLRARGCRCTLRWHDGMAQPLNASEAADCKVDHTIAPI